MSNWSSQEEPRNSADLFDYFYHLCPLEDQFFSHFSNHQASRHHPIYDIPKLPLASIPVAGFGTFGDFQTFQYTWPNIMQSWEWCLPQSKNYGDSAVPEVFISPQLLPSGTTTIYRVTEHVHAGIFLSAKHLNDSFHTIFPHPYPPSLPNPNGDLDKLRLKVTAEKALLQSAKHSNLMFQISRRNTTLLSEQLSFLRYIYHIVFQHNYLLYFGVPPVEFETGGEKYLMVSEPTLCLCGGSKLESSTFYSIFLPIFYSDKITSPNTTMFHCKLTPTKLDINQYHFRLQSAPINALFPIKHPNGSHNDSSMETSSADANSNIHSYLKYPNINVNQNQNQNFSSSSTDAIDTALINSSWNDTTYNITNLMPFFILHLTAALPKSHSLLFSFVLFHLHLQQFPPPSFNPSTPVIIIFQDSRDLDTTCCSEYQIQTIIHTYLQIECFFIPQDLDDTDDTDDISNTQNQNSQEQFEHTLTHDTQPQSHPPNFLLLNPYHRPSPPHFVLPSYKPTYYKPFSPHSVLPSHKPFQSVLYELDDQDIAPPRLSNTTSLSTPNWRVKFDNFHHVTRRLNNLIAPLLFANFDPSITLFKSNTRQLKKKVPNFASFRYPVFNILNFPPYLNLYQQYCPETVNVLKWSKLVKSFDEKKIHTNILHLQIFVIPTNTRPIRHYCLYNGIDTDVDTNSYSDNDTTLAPKSHKDQQTQQQWQWNSNTLKKIPSFIPSTKLNESLTDNAFYNIITEYFLQLYVPPSPSSSLSLALSSSTSYTTPSSSQIHDASRDETQAHNDYPQQNQACPSIIDQSSQPPLLVQPPCGFQGTHPYSSHSHTFKLSQIHLSESSESSSILDEKNNYKTGISYYTIQNSLLNSNQYNVVCLKDGTDLFQHNFQNQHQNQHQELNQEQNQEQNQNQQALIMKIYSPDSNHASALNLKKPPDIINSGFIDPDTPIDPVDLPHHIIPTTKFKLPIEEILTLEESLMTQTIHIANLAPNLDQISPSCQGENANETPTPISTLESLSHATILASSICQSTQSTPSAQSTQSTQLPQLSQPIQRFLVSLRTTLPGDRLRTSKSMVNTMGIIDYSKSISESSLLFQHSGRSELAQYALLSNYSPLFCPGVIFVNYFEPMAPIIISRPQVPSSTCASHMRIPPYATTVFPYPELNMINPALPIFIITMLPTSEHHEPHVCPLPLYLLQTDLTKPKYGWDFDLPKSFPSFMANNFSQLVQYRRKKTWTESFVSLFSSAQPSQNLDQNLDLDFSHRYDIPIQVYSQIPNPGLYQALLFQYIRHATLSIFNISPDDVLATQYQLPFQPSAAFSHLIIPTILNGRIAYQIIVKGNAELIAVLPHIHQCALAHYFLSQSSQIFNIEKEKEKEKNEIHV